MSRGLSWQQLQLTVASGDVAVAEALLTLAGAEAISLHDASDTPQLEPAPADTPLWPRVEVRALFGIDAELAALRRALAERFSRARVIVTALADEDWQLALRERVEPRRIGRRLELRGADMPASAVERTVVRLNMGFAFGTGAHPTTRLCLEWLDGALPPGSAVLDYGCGSGVLAIAALALGARSACAVDNDPQAVIAARANASLNGVAGRLWAGSWNQLPERQFDAVLANIVAGTLEDAAPLLAARTAHGGRIVLAGLLEDQCSRVRSAYAPYFGDFEIVTADGWTRIVARRAAG